MTAKTNIQNRVSQVYDEPTPNVYRGTDYNGSVQATGWWYRPFNANPIWLGPNQLTALETLEQIETYRNED